MDNIQKYSYKIANFLSENYAIANKIMLTFVIKLRICEILEIYFTNLKYFYSFL